MIVCQIKRTNLNNQSVTVRLKILIDIYFFNLLNLFFYIKLLQCQASYQKPAMVEELKDLLHLLKKSIKIKEEQLLNKNSDI